MAKSNIPQISIRDSLIELRCSICENILSIPPITITSGDGNEYKCGRCSFVKTEVNMPAILFKKFASTLTFPCIFRNCNEEIPWNDVKSHENSCIHRPFICFCGETMEIQEAKMHFTERHPDKTSKNKLTLVGGHCKKLRTRFILKDSLPFLVYIFYEKCKNTSTLTAGQWRQFIYIGVYNILDTGSSDQQYQFKLEMTNSKKVKFIIPDLRVQRYNVRVHCSNCLLGTCQIRYHRYQDSRENSLIPMIRKQIDYDLIEQVLGNGNFDLTLTVIKRDDRALVKNEELRKAWECPICLKYMTALIFLCPTGHSLCGTCKDQVALCPLCKLEIGESRNYTLEQIAVGPTWLTCQYESKGCQFGGNVVEVAEHERNCDKALSSPQP